MKKTKNSLSLAEIIIIAVGGVLLLGSVVGLILGVIYIHYWLINSLLGLNLTYTQVLFIHLVEPPIATVLTILGRLLSGEKS